MRTNFASKVPDKKIPKVKAMLARVSPELKDRFDTVVEKLKKTDSKKKWNQKLAMTSVIELFVEFYERKLGIKKET